MRSATAQRHAVNVSQEASRSPLRVVLHSIGASALGAALLCGAAVPAAAQDAADRTAEFSALLQEVSDRTNGVTQQQFYLSQQQAQIESLRARIAEARRSDAQAELRPILNNMIAGLDRVMTSDLPFAVEQRFALLDDLRDDMRSLDASIPDGFRRALDLYAAEVELGLSVGSYTGNNPVEPGGRYQACLADPMSARCALSDEQKDQLASVENRPGVDATDVIEDFNGSNQLPDGNYIHYGRLALFYLERDSSVGYRYDLDNKAWEPISNSDLLGLRQNVRIARGESAVSTMTVPIQVGERGADAS